MSKLVSIGLPTYNGSKTIRRALDTLLAQTYKDFELIISDNASTDETGKICEEYAARDARVRYIRQKDNIGPLANFRFVTTVARGNYFMWAADDDWWEPKFIETLARALDKNPYHDVAMSSYRLVYPEGEIKNDVIYQGEWDFSRDSYYRLYKKMMLGVPALMFIYGLYRKQFLDKLIARSQPNCVFQDRILMAEAALSTHFYSVPEVLYLRTFSRLNVRSNHADDEVGKFYLSRFPYTYSVWMTLKWLLTSRIVPLSRKFMIFWPWFLLVRHRWPRMKHEIVKSWRTKNNP